MKKKFGGVIFLGALFALMLFVRNRTTAPVVTSSSSQEIRSQLFHFELQTQFPMPQGCYYISAIEAFRSDNHPHRGELLEISTVGQIIFDRAFVNESTLQDLIPINFQVFEDGIASYFLGREDHLRCPAQVFFLDPTLHDLLRTSYHLESENLDCHELLSSREKTLFAMYASKAPEDLILKQELRETNAQGKIIFRWSPQEHLQVEQKSSEDQADPFHMNSFTLPQDGALWVSLGNRQSVVKVAYPTGQVLQEISTKGWKFTGDPLNGFGRLHSVSTPAKDHILFFDNGTNERPQSRMVEYKINEVEKTAQLVQEFRYPGKQNYRYVGGSAQRIDGEYTLIGWGAIDDDQDVESSNQNLIATSIDSRGQVVQSLYSKEDLVSYRVKFGPCASVAP